MTIHIGPVCLDGSVVLAPMSGISDLPFRRLVKRCGVGLVVSEMIASKAMVSARHKTLRMSAPGAEEYPMAVQLAGCEPEVMAEAARLNEDRGAALIDINMGCPVKKVVKGDAGSALMRDEPLARRILEAVVKAVKLPVTLKMRTGWDESTLNAPRLARIAEDCGIRAITVHGRTRCQFYRDRSDWRFIGEVKRAVRIPVIGNGDVCSVDDAVTLLEVSGADGVMIGRAACGRPWFPRQVSDYLKSGRHLADPPLSVQVAMVLEHFEDMLLHYGRETGVRMARKHIGWYSKGLPGSAEFRADINRTSDADQVRAKIGRFYGPLAERMAA